MVALGNALLDDDDLGIGDALDRVLDEARSLALSYRQTRAVAPQHANLTRRQSEVLAAIRRYIDEHGYGPSNRDLGRILGIRSTNGVADHLTALARKGAITRPSGTARAITIARAS